MYDGFFTSLEPAYLDRVGEAIAAAGFAMPMLCCSPDFTNPDADGAQAGRRPRSRADRRHATAWAARARSAGSSPGSAIPRSAGRRGSNGSSSASTSCCPWLASTTSSWAWRTTTRTASGSIPSSPRRRTCSSSCVAAIPDRDHFGVQYDPSNAIVAGDDPIALLRAVADRVVSMHASDRYLAEGTTLDDLRQSDGTLGLFAQPAARRHRQGPERLRRHLPHPGRAPLSGAGSASRTA